MSLQFLHISLGERSIKHLKIARSGIRSCYPNLYWTKDCLIISLSRPKSKNYCPLSLRKLEDEFCNLPYYLSAMSKSGRVRIQMGKKWTGAFLLGTSFFLKQYTFSPELSAHQLFLDTVGLTYKKLQSILILSSQSCPDQRRKNIYSTY